MKLPVTSNETFPIEKECYLNINLVYMANTFSIDFETFVVFLRTDRCLRTKAAELYEVARMNCSECTLLELQVSRL